MLAVLIVTVVAVAASTVAPDGMPAPLTVCPAATPEVALKFSTLEFAAVDELVVMENDRVTVPCS